MADKEIEDTTLKEIPAEEGAVEDGVVSRFEKALYLYRDDRLNWLLILAVCLIIVATFHFPFQWMLNQWFFVEENSPGPLVPILIIVIFQSQLKKMKSCPIYPRRQLYILIGVAVILGFIAYFGKDNKNRYPQYEIYSKIAFDILFYFLTVVLIYAAYLFARERKLHPPEVEDKKSDKLFLGMAALVFGLVFHFLGMRGDLNRISILSYVTVMYGFTWFVFGKEVSTKLIFPYAILLFLIPMEFLDDYIGGPLRLFAARASVGIMKGISPIIGMEVVREGTKFTINGAPFDVAPACSGLRSLVALTVIGAVYAFITQPGLLRKCLLGLCAIPIAVLTNVMRLVLVGITCHYFGSKSALWVHDNAIFLYVLAIVALFSLDKIFDRIAKSKWIKAKLKWLKIKDF